MMAESEIAMGIRKKRQKVFALSAILTTTLSLGLAGYYVSTSINEVKATNSSIITSVTTGGYIHSRELDINKKFTNTDSESPLLRKKFGPDSLPSYYNSHDYYNTYTRTKNQNTEGLCWLYASSTSLEYTLEKNGKPTSISPKHMDYQFVSATNAYKDSGVSNEHYDRWLSAGGYERELGDGGNHFTLLLALSNPYALVSESTFAQIIKANDNRISGISKYEDIWELNNYEDILTSKDGGAQIYDVKQSYNEINKASNTEYVVDGIGEIFYPSYGASSEKTKVVNLIKEAVKEYGAVAVGTYFDSDNCMDVNYDEDNNEFNLTIIDRSNNYTTLCNESTGHEMAIIGWDDNWTYKDNNVDKNGAFIIQNSYGEYFTYDDTNFPWNFYMSYDSAFDVAFFTSLDSLSNYNHYYSVGDYKTATIEANNKEYVFEFTAEGNEKLEKITFNQNFDSTQNLDVYVSNTGKDMDFVKVGSFSALMGMTSYVFEPQITVSGNFAIKLKINDSGAVYVNERDEPTVRALNILNVYTTDKENTDPTDPTGPTDPTDPDDPETPDQPTGTGSIEWEDNNDIYLIGVDDKLVVTIDYPLSSFESLLIDDAELESKNYDLRSGSTIITLHGDYLDTLESGLHTLKALFSNNQAIETKFSVLSDDIEIPKTDGPSAPETGLSTKNSDGNTPAALYALPTISAITIIAFILIKVKKSKIAFNER